MTTFLELLNEAADDFVFEYSIKSTIPVSYSEIQDSKEFQSILSQKVPKREKIEAINALALEIAKNKLNDQEAMPWKKDEVELNLVKGAKFTDIKLQHSLKERPGETEQVESEEEPEQIPESDV